MGMSRFKGQVEQIWKFELSPVESGPCSRVRCTHPIMHHIRIWWNGKGTAFRDQRKALVSVPQTHDSAVLHLHQKTRIFLAFRFFVEKLLGNFP